MTKKCIGAITLISLLSGCATMQRPTNEHGSFYAWQQPLKEHEKQLHCHSASSPEEIRGLNYAEPSQFLTSPDTLNGGDSISLSVAGDSDKLTGTYIIADNGEITLLGQHRIMIAGRSALDAQRLISETLYNQSLIRRKNAGVNLTIAELSGVRVAVKGAVFDQGLVRLGDKNAETRNVNFSNIQFGDANPGRNMSTALRAAGGVRPDAEIRTIFLIRGDQWTQIDMRGAITGKPIDDIPVRLGDTIIVPSIGCLQEALVRPTAITQPGIRIYLSNLSRPALNNASSANTVDTEKMPYGTRLSQAMVAANCVGGSSMNAARQVVLMSRNPYTGQSVVISRSVEKLVRNADRDSKDPYLMPGDAIACYDSMAMNLRDVVSVFSETITPVILFNSLD